MRYAKGNMHFALVKCEDGSLAAYLADTGDIAKVQRDIDWGTVISVHRIEMPERYAADAERGFAALLKLNEVCEPNAGPARLLEQVFLLGYMAGRRA